MIDLGEGKIKKQAATTTLKSRFKFHTFLRSPLIITKLRLRDVQNICSLQFQSNTK